MIRRTFKKIVRWAMSYNDPRDAVLVDCDAVRSSLIDSDNGMRFSLYKASGGYVVEFRQYDQKTDRSDNKLHIINNDEDIGEKIGQIITLELLRN